MVADEHKTQSALAKHGEHRTMPKLFKHGEKKDRCLAVRSMLTALASTAGTAAWAVSHGFPRRPRFRGGSKDQRGDFGR